MYIMIAVLLGISPESGQEMWVGEYIGLLFAGGIQSPLSFFEEVYQRLPWSTPPLTLPAHHIHLIPSSDWSDLPPLFPLCRYKYGSILSILIHNSSPLEDGTDTGSETSAFNNNQTPGKCPEELLSSLKHGESLKHRIMYIHLSKNVINNPY